MNMTKTNVEQGSTEWQHLEYRLQLFLGLPAASPVTIYRFEAAAHDLQEMQNAYAVQFIIIQGKEQTDACLDTTNMDDTSFKKLFSRKTDMKSLWFETGHLVVDTHNEPLTRRYSMLLARIVVGDSYCIQESEADLIDNIPEPYDSCYVLTNEEQDSAYRHNYILKNRSQYVIQYEIVFVLNREKQYNPRDTICNKCEKRTAVAYCRQEEAYFCSECNITHHKDKLLSNHHREPINKLNSLGRCASHGRQLTLYCQDEGRFLCIDCTLSGDHSSGQFAAHRTVMLEKFYNEKELDNGRVSVEKKEELTADLNRIEDYIKQITEHTEEVHSKLMEKFERALNELKRINKSKVDELLSVKMSIKRQLDQCVWTQSFIRYQQQVLKPEFYVEAQAQFDQYMLMLMEGRTRPIKAVDTQNIIIEGEVIVSEKRSRSRSGSARSRKPGKNPGLDFFERNQQGERNIKSNANLNNPQAASRFTDMHPRTEFNRPVGARDTPSGKESNFSNRFEPKVSEINPTRPQVPTLPLPGRTPASSRFETGRSRNIEQSSGADYSPSEQQGTSNRRAAQTKQSPSKLSASESLKARFGQLGLKATFV